MEGYYALYNPEKTYTTKEGKIYTSEMFALDYPAVHSANMAVYLFGNTIENASTVSYLRGINRIKPELTDEDAMKELTYKYELEETESTPIERIAASLEYLTLLFMGDK